MSRVSSPPQPSSTSGVRRELSLLDCFGIGINGILGSGIFFLPATIHRIAGGRAPLAWLLIGALCVLVALCFAEAASRTDRSGGPYRYASEAFGNTFGFAVGWVTLVSSALGYTAVARAFGVAAAKLAGHPGLTPLELSLSCAVVFSLCAINIAGVRPGAKTGDLLSVIKIGSLLSFVAIGLFYVDWGFVSAPPAPRRDEPVGIVGAAFAGLFAMTGFEYVPVPAGETRNPQRSIPLAMVLSVGGAMLLYTLVQIVAAGTTPNLGGSDVALMDSAGAFGGRRGYVLIGVASLISVYGFCAGSALVGPRYLELFSQDRYLPRGLSWRSPRFHTPVYAVVALSVAVLALLLLPLVSHRLAAVSRFEGLANISNVAVLLQYMATCAAVLVLRRRPRPPGSFQVPFGPLLPIVGLGGSLLALFYVGKAELLVAAGLIALGLVSGGLYRRWVPGPSTEIPAE